MRFNVKMCECAASMSVGVCLRACLNVWVRVVMLRGVGCE